MKDEMKNPENKGNTGNAEQPSDLFIRIDTRYNRIHLHKSTLKAIGDPEYIHLGYQPKTKTLMILGTWVNEQKAVHLRFSKTGSCYVHSKAMIEGIQRISGVLKGKFSCLLCGERSDNFPAVCFPLEDAKVLNEGSADEPDKEQEHGEK